MRWLLSLSVACLTAVCCNYAWTQSRGWDFIWWRPSAECRGEVHYSNLTGSTQSPFVETSSGLTVVGHPKGWAYTQALLLPDLDGDECADLALMGTRSSHCGNDVEGNLEIYSGADLTPVGEYAGYAAFSLEVSSQGAVLEVRHHGWKGPEVSVREDPRVSPLWKLATGQRRACYVDDLDGDGLEEVALSETFVQDAVGAHVGSVSLCAGADGRTIWTALGQGSPRFGSDVTSCGDQDGDGNPDVAVLSEHSIAILSGVNGELFADALVSPTDELRSLSGVGDLDGDGSTDFGCRVDSATRKWIFYSSSTWQSLETAGGWRVLWSASDGDLDGDGRDDLVVGRAHPRTGERRLSIFSSAGLIDVRFVGGDEPSWDFTGAASVGRFHEGEPWHVLLPVNWGGHLWEEGAVVIYPGL